jgi:MipA family protein
MTRFRNIIFLGLYAAALPAGVALADDEHKSDWKFTVGGFGNYSPDYLGSNDYEFSPVPMVEISYKDRLYLKGNELGWRAFQTENIEGGLLGRYSFGRDEDDNDALRGLGDVYDSVELGGFLTYNTGPVAWGVTVVQDVADGHGGWIADFEAGYHTALAPKLMLFGKASAQVMSQEAMESYFGISSTQATASGYRAHAVDTGLSQVGLSLGLDYALTEAWHLTGIGGVSQLVGDAADSPIVDDAGSATQFSLMTGVSYHF